MTQMIKCPACGNEMAKTAKACPSCGAKNKKPFYKKWWIWAILIVIVIAAAASSGGGNDAEPNTAKDPVVEKNSPKISKAEFEALETGMTYEDVVAIIGGEGELTSQVDLAGYETKLYMWEGEGSIGANANVTFQNNSLASKAQFGLE